jgi:hypothetical protein
VAEYRTNLILEDECPRIGTGLRTVAIKEGSKWAYVTEVSTGRRQRLTVDELDVIERKSERRLGASQHPKNDEALSNLIDGA